MQEVDDGAACFDTCRPNSRVPNRPLPARNPNLNLRPHPSPLEVFLQHNGKVPTSKRRFVCSSDVPSPRYKDEDTDDEVLLARLLNAQYAVLPIKLFQSSKKRSVKKRAKSSAVLPPAVHPQLPPWTAPTEELKRPSVNTARQQYTILQQPTQAPSSPLQSTAQPPFTSMEPALPAMQSPIQSMQAEWSPIMQSVTPPQSFAAASPQTQTAAPQMQSTSAPQSAVALPQMQLTAASSTAASPTAASANAASPTAASPTAASLTAASPTAPSPVAALPTAASPVASLPTAALPTASSHTAHPPIAASPTAALPSAVTTQSAATSTTPMQPSMQPLQTVTSSSVGAFIPMNAVSLQQLPLSTSIQTGQMYTMQHLTSLDAARHYRSPTTVLESPPASHTRVVSMPVERLVQTMRDRSPLKDRNRAVSRSGSADSAPRRTHTLLSSSQGDRRPRKPVSRFNEPKQQPLPMLTASSVTTTAVAPPVEVSESPPPSIKPRKRKVVRKKVEVGVQTTEAVACCCAVHGPLRPVGGHAQDDSSEEPNIMTVPLPVVPTLKLPTREEPGPLPETAPAESFEEAQRLPVSVDLTSRLRVAVSAAQTRSTPSGTPRSARTPRSAARVFSKDSLSESEGRIEDQIPSIHIVQPEKQPGLASCAPAHVILLDADDTLIPTSELCETKFLDHDLANLPESFQASLNLLDEQLTRLFEELHSMVVLENDATEDKGREKSNYVLSVVIITNATLSHIQSTFEKFLPKLVGFFQARKIKVDELVCSARDIWSEEFPFEHFYEFWKAWTLEDILRELKNDGVTSVTVLTIGDDEPERKAAAYVESEMDGFVQSVKILKMVTQPTIQDLLVQLKYIHEHLREYVARTTPFDLQLDLENGEKVIESAQLSNPEIPDRIEALFIQFELKYEILFDAFRTMDKADVLRFVSSLRVLKVRQATELSAFVDECNQFLAVYRANSQPVDLTPPALSAILEDFPSEPPVTHRSQDQEAALRDPAVILNALQSVIKFLLQYPNLVSTLPNFGWHPPSSADFIVAAVHLFLAAVASANSPPPSSPPPPPQRIATKQSLDG